LNVSRESSPAEVAPLSAILTSLSSLMSPLQHWKRIQYQTASKENNHTTTIVVSIIIIIIISDGLANNL